MYAIVENGSKQYKAEVGSVIRFEKLSANVGDKVEFDVLMVADEAGIKVADQAKAFKAVGEVLEQGKDKKIIVFKYKAKKNERKKQGHRQPFTAVKILEIVAKEEVAAPKKTTRKAPAKKAEAEAVVAE